MSAASNTDKHFKGENPPGAKRRFVSSLTATRSYLLYLLRHKWFVFRAGVRLGVPLWQLLIHDWTKLLPSEWFGYVHYFRDRRSEFSQGRLDGRREDWSIDSAWNHHQKCCPHHWQYWVLIEDGPSFRPLPMPERYVREMVADWEGAGRAKGGIDARGWFLRDGGKMLLHPRTRLLVEEILKINEPDANL